MPSRQTVEAFVALVEAGDYVGAIEHFYAPDASTQENTGEPVVGRDVLMAKERGVMARFRKIEASRIGPVLIEGDTVTARWKFTFTGADGSSRTLEEIAWQTWRGDRLVEERFFYDPRQMAAG
jgi:ketosteroid isomerase-like protein